MRRVCSVSGPGTDRRRRREMGEETDNRSDGYFAAGERTIEIA